jgi:uroporphyrinogen-III synthase
MAMLRILARQPGQVVDRETLRGVLPGAGDLHAVEVAVARLRAGIGRDGVVRTVVKRGYRLDVVERDAIAPDVVAQDVAEPGH